MITSSVGWALAFNPSDMSGPTDGVSSSIDPAQIVVATLQADPGSLDPVICYDTVGGEIIQNVYETLVFYDGPSATTLTPMLCDEVPTVANGLITDSGYTYTYNLRPGVKFHDGTTMDSTDVYYSFERALRLNDKNGPVWMVGEVLIPSFYSYAASSFDGDGNLVDGIPADVIQQHIWASDPDTIVFNLTVPFAGWNYVMTSGVSSIVSKEYVEANGGETLSGYDFMAYNMCGTGAFSFTEFVPSDHTLLTRFDDYRQGPAQVASVLIEQIADESTRILMIQSGEADFASILRSSRSSVEGYAGIEIGEGNGTFTLEFLGLNQAIDLSALDPAYTDVTANFFSDINVRKAFACAFDYDTYLSTNYPGSGFQPNGAIPQGMFGYSPDVPTYDFNLTLARDYLENGTTNYLENGFKLEIFYNSGNIVRQSACELFKAGLESVSDKIEITATVLDWPTYLYMRRNGQLPVYFLGWAPDYADPNDYVQPFLNSYGTYLSSLGYSNATLDQMINDAMVEQDVATRAAMYEEISNDTYEECLYIWTVQMTQFNVHRSWVDGYIFNPMYSGLYYYPMSLDIHLPPGAPTGLAAVPGDGMVSLSWTAPAYEGTEPVDHYGVYQDDVLITTVTGLSYDVTGLTNGVSYSFYVKAHNAVDYGEASSSAVAVPFRLPGAPTGLAGTFGTDHIDLTWTAPADPGDPALDYYVVYKDGTDIAHVTSTSATVTGLTNGTAVHFAVKAYNVGGLSGPADLYVNVPVALPSAPQNLRATSYNVTVGLAWNAPSSNGGTSIQYYILYQDGTDIAHPTGTSYDVTGLAIGTEYVFSVTAKNSVGTGPASNTVHVTPKSVPGVPTNVTLTVAGKNMTISWTAPSSNGSDPIDKYLVTVNGIGTITTATHLDLTDLTPGTRYNVTVKAHNSLGYGNAAATVNATIALPPSAVASIIYQAGDGYVSILWNQPASNGGAAITSYVVRLNGTVYANVTSISLNITGLVNGASYNISVSAVNVIGEGPAMSITATPLGLPHTPASPQTQVAGDQVNATWSAPADTGGAPVQYYLVYQDGVYVGTTNNTWFVFDNLTAGEHYFSVKAHTSAGDSEAMSFTATIQAAEEKSSDQSMTFIAIGAVAAIVIVAAVVLLLRRKG